MTEPTWLPDLEEELPLPATRGSVRPEDKATGPGKAEIKKHDHNGILKGLRQLGAGPGPRSPRDFVQRGVSRGQERYLITYRSLPPNGLAQVDVHAVKFARDTVVPTTVPAVMAMRWMFLGRVAAPTVPAGTPSRQYDSVFGGLVEKPVRALFIKTVVRPRKGAFKGRPHDVVWDELADFYRELAAELSPSGGSFRF